MNDYCYTHKLDCCWTRTAPRLKASNPLRKGRLTRDAPRLLLFSALFKLKHRNSPFVSLSLPFCVLFFYRGMGASNCHPLNQSSTPTRNVGSVQAPLCLPGASPLSSAEGLCKAEGVVSLIAVCCSQVVCSKTSVNFSPSSFPS